MSTAECNIVIGGEAGQGLVTVGLLLSRVLVRAGYHIVATQSYESRIRGGHNAFRVRASPEEIGCPQEPVDILVALNEETVTRHESELSLRGIVVVDAALDRDGQSHLRVPYAELAEGKYANVVALGVTCALLGIDADLTGGMVEEFFSKAGSEVAQTNRSSAMNGYRWMAEQEFQFPALPPAAATGSRLTMTGHDAIALGALSAGLKFFSFYPMSPSTSIATALTAHSREMGVVVVQAEDEIAAINMALGASFAGAPSMVATSGGGFTLMGESVSLSAMTETPVVIIVAQRPGPATGLPTRTEQADLEMVLHSGHGEFPRAIFAPATTEECFYLIRKAFELAEKSRGPVFVLTDQFLADSYRDVEPFPIGELEQVATCVEISDAEEPYRTYRLTESGVTPRLIPGHTVECSKAYSSEQLVVADSDEHTEAGQITEDLSIRKAMVDKRMRKLEVIKKNVLYPAVTGDDPAELVLVSWGSTRGAALEAAALLRAEGKTVATVQVSQVWPLPLDHLLEMFARAAEVICVEGNATGQLARLIRRETGFAVARTVLRYDGLPITPEFILRELRKETEE